MDTFWSFATSKTDLILIFIIVVGAVFEVLYSPDPCSASCSSSELWTNSTWGEGQRPFVQCTRIHDVSHVGFIMYLNGEGKLDVIYKFFYLHYRFWVPSVTEEKPCTCHQSSPGVSQDGFIGVPGHPVGFAPNLLVPSLKRFPFTLQGISKKVANIIVAPICLWTAWKVS